MKLKLAIVGPSGSGKSTIANLLANEGFGDNANSHLPYRSTHSIRIVEFAVPSVELTKYSMEVDVQLWEIGGSPRLKNIWPGVQHGLDGVILVYDVNSEAHVRDSSAFFMHFVTHAPSNISPNQCLIVGNVFRGQKESGVQKIVGIGQRVRHIAVNIDDDASYLREEFRHFLTGVANIIFDREKSNMMANSTKSVSRFRAHDFKCRTVAKRSTPASSPSPSPTCNESFASPRKRSANSKYSAEKVSLNTIFEKLKGEIRSDDAVD